MTKLAKMTLENDGVDDKDGARRRIHLREISGDSENPLESVGQDLRAARLRRRLGNSTLELGQEIRCSE